MLVVAPLNSEVRALGEALVDDEFDVSIANDAAAGLEQIEGNGQYSLVVADAQAIADHDAFLLRIRDRHRDLPVIWIRRQDDQRRFAGDAPRAVLVHPVPAATFRLTAGSLVSGDFYPRAVVQGLVSAGNAVLALSCETSVDAETPWLKQTETLLGTVHAYISFMSDQAMGHLLTSGDIPTLTALGERLGLDLESGLRQVAIDMAGEIGNQVLGRMKSVCGDMLAGVKMGVPVVWLGDHVHAHFSSERPNLALTLTTEFGPVHLNFGFARMNTKDPDAGVPDGFMDSGDVQLF
jgi:CheY-specific phosphatase CheX